MAIMIRAREVGLLLAAFGGLLSLTTGAETCFAQAGRPTKNTIQLTDVTRESGIDFVHSSGASGIGYIVEAMTGGVALFDYDNDGWIDIFFCNGSPLKGSKESADKLHHRLYRNLGNWKFQDVTEESGLKYSGYGLGAVVADYDNDGDQDLFLTHFGKNVLFRNNGDKTFTNVTADAGVEGRF